MLYAIMVTLVLVADQWLKYWVTVNITLATGEMPLIPGIVKLVNVHNSGAAFGMLKDSPIAKWLFVGLAAAFTLLVIIVLVKKVITSRFGAWCAVFAVAGAVGNCIDRLMYGYVVDMFKLEFMDFAVFNVADIVLCVSCLLFIIFLFVGEKDTGKAKEKAPEEVCEPSEPEDYEQPERKLKIKLRGKGEERAASASFDSSFDLFDKTDPEEEQRRLREDEEFWSALKFATGKGEKPQPAAKKEIAPEEMPVFKIPEEEREEAPVTAPELKLPEEEPVIEPPVTDKTDDFDLDSILAEFKDL